MSPEPCRFWNSPQVSKRAGRVALVVDRDLAVGVDVVEDGHPLGADDGQHAPLVRVEPGDVVVRHHARRERQVGEDDVLDAVAQEALAARRHLARALAGEGQGQRDVVRREAPERVLVLPHLPEVDAVGVQVAGRRPSSPAPASSSTMRKAGWKRSRWPTISRRSRSRASVDELAGVLDGQRERLLDEAVLAGLEHDAAESRVARGAASRRRSPSRSGSLVRSSRCSVNRVVGNCGAKRGPVGRIQVAAPRELGAGQPRDVARQVRAPVAEADDAEADGRDVRACGHGRSWCRAAPVALRKSTTSVARSTTRP